MPKIIDPNKATTFWGVKIKGTDEYVTTSGSYGLINRSKKVSIYNREADALRLANRCMDTLKLRRDELEVVPITLSPVVGATKSSPATKIDDVVIEIATIKPKTDADTDRRHLISLKLIDIVADQLCCKKSKVSDLSKTVRDYGADSLDMVELVMYIEDEFDVEIADDEAESFIEEPLSAYVDFLMKLPRIDLTIHSQPDSKHYAR